MSESVVNQISHLNDGTLFELMRNDSARPEFQIEAAKLLYARASKFIAAPEFVKYRQQVLDSVLDSFAVKKADAPFSLNTTQDALGRVHQRVADVTDSLNDTTVRHDQEIASVDGRAKERDQKLSDSTTDSIASLETKLRACIQKTDDELASAKTSIKAELDKLKSFARSVKRWGWGIGIAAVAGTAGSIVYHFLK